MQQPPDANLQTRESEKTVLSIASLVSAHFAQLTMDVIAPVRVVAATFIVFLAFFIADEILLYVIRWAARDIASRVPFVTWLLDGVQVLSLTGVAVYFAISGIANLQTLWKIGRRIEEEAGLQ